MLVLSGLICVLFILLISKLTICIHINHQMQDTELSIQIYWFGLQIVKRIYKLNDTSLTVDNNYFQNISEQFKQVFKMIKQGEQLLSIVLRQFVIRRLYWHTKGGTGDAALTGMIAGGVWSLKGMITGWMIQNSKQSCLPDLQVIPLFQHKGVEMFFSCMVSTRFAQAIHIILQLQRELVKTNDSIRSEHSWKSIRFKD
ncbi:DUF2953 domain-containing protein [Virgibacillus proomii]|uniref:DUF2953 domain-containing protein n=1 Tax=Virgibacillus proomii TaxID=84407 RepID=UPI0015C38441|nr:DUF2953 domain-containing protein [Virgibacillus proomii]